MKYLGKWYGEHRCTIHMEASPGGGLPCKLDRGRCSSEILKRTPKRNQDPVLWAWLEFEVPILQSIFFRLITT